MENFVRPEELTKLEEALHSVKRKINDLDADYFTFFATSQHLRDGLDAQASFAQVFVDIRFLSRRLTFVMPYV